MDVEGARRIWILNHHAELNGHRHFELGKCLVRMGLDITVVASSFSHTDYRYRTEDPCSIQEIGERMRYAWLRTSPPYYGNGLGRVRNMISYARMARRYARELWTKYGRPDIVIGSSVHPFAWEAAHWIATRTGARFVAEVRDLWPLSLVEIAGMSPYHPLVLLFGALERRAYRRAHKIITTMPYAYKYICEERYRFPRNKVVWIPNGIDRELIDRPIDDAANTLPEPLDRFLQQHWCCVYAGSLAESECVDCIIDAAAVLAERGDRRISFAIIGDGHEKARLMENVDSLGIGNVRFFDRISKAQVAVALRKAGCCCAALRNLPIYRFGLSLNKLNDYLISGRPTILACDAPNIVRESGGGISIPYGDPALLADTIQQVYGMDEASKASMCSKGLQAIKQDYTVQGLASRFVTEVLGEDARTG